MAEKTIRQNDAKTTNTGQVQGDSPHPKEIKIDGMTLFLATGQRIHRFILASGIEDARKIAAVGLHGHVGHVGISKIKPQSGTPVLVQVEAEKPGEKAAAKDKRAYERRGGVGYELRKIKG